MISGKSYHKYRCKCINSPENAKYVQLDAEKDELQEIINEKDAETKDYKQDVEDLEMEKIALESDDKQLNDVKKQYAHRLFKLSTAKAPKSPIMKKH